MTIEFELAASFPVANRIGECVLWDDRTGIAWWTDIPARRLWSWRFGTDQLDAMALPESLASLALTDTPGEFIGAFESGFARFAPALESFDPLVAIEPARPGLAMNDGRVDRAGWFWASTKMVDPDDPGARADAKLWRLDGRGAATSFLGGLKVPNGLAFSANSRSMFLADSEAGLIWKFVLEGEDGPIDGAPFARAAPGVKPDGACLDAQGRLWSAQWGGGEVLCYNPHGAIEARLALPVSQPSCVAFGGPSLDHLLVTTAREGLSAGTLAREPLAGSLFVYRTSARGRPEDRCVTDFALCETSDRATMTSAA